LVAAIAAIASSVLAGLSAGVVAAAAALGHGVRPRRRLRERSRIATRWGGSVAIAAAAVAAAGVIAERHGRVALALTCLAVILLLALAAWLLLIERDEGGPGEAPDEPEWWPAFERELDEWTRRSRVPAHRR
jgi:MFS family permease